MPQCYAYSTYSILHVICMHSQCAVHHVGIVLFSVKIHMLVL